MPISKLITVKSTDQKLAKNGTPYLEVIAQDDKKTPIFDQKLWNLFTPGAKVEITLEKKGQFWNVLNASPYEVIEEPPPEEIFEGTEPPQKSKPKPSDEKKAVYYSYMKDIAVAGINQGLKGDALDDLLCQMSGSISTWAEALYEYAIGNKEITPKKEPPKKPQPPPQVTTATTEASIALTGGKTPTAPVFKSFGELASAANKLGVSGGDIFKAAGVKAWTDFTSYLDAWNWVETIVADREAIKRGK